VLVTGSPPAPVTGFTFLPEQADKANTEASTNSVKVLRI
jgi:hypothetical protein